MKILSITAGAANMYCGSCLRDNALATELIRLGHEVILLPLYTPTRTDERNVSHERVFFGGISIYLATKSSLFRSTRRWLDGILDSRWLLKMVSKRSMSVDPKGLGELTVATLEGTNGPYRKEVDKLLEWLEREPPPDVICLSYTLLISLAKPLREALGRPISCGIQGEDLFLEGLPEPYRSRSLDLIREHSPYVDAFLPTCEFYAKSMSEYLGIPAEKMHVSPIGINLVGHGPAERRSDGGRRIGYLARVAPEKGLHVLAEAFTQLKDIDDVTLEAAGYLAPENRGYLAECERTIRRHGLEDRFHYHGELSREEKIDFLRRLDVLSVPCTYHEPKGLFLLEAMANGVPVVQPPLGSFPEIVGKTGGGLIAETADAASVAAGLRRVLADAELARQLSLAGAVGVSEHYGVERMAARTMEVLDALVRAG